MKIKDSTHVIVKSHHPARKTAAIVLLVIVVMALGYLLYEYGRYSSGFDSVEANSERDALQSRIDEQDKQITQLTKQNEILRQGKEVDRLAYAEVDQSLSDLQSENMELKEELEFYHGIVGTAEEVRGLQIRNFKLTKDDSPQRFHYRLILTQFIRGNRYISGHVSLSLSGVLNGIEKSLSHNDFVQQGPDDMKFRFKHFQELQGVIVLPEGFVPIRITLNIIPVDKSHKPIEQTFSWSDVIT